MPDSEDKGRGAPGETLSSAAIRAQQALDAAKDLIAASDLDELRAKAAPEFDKAKNELRESIRRNPLAAIGIAFVAGLLLALLTRG